MFVAAEPLGAAAAAAAALASMQSLDDLTCAYGSAHGVCWLRQSLTVTLDGIVGLPLPLPVGLQKESLTHVQGTGLAVIGCL